MTKHSRHVGWFTGTCAQLTLPMVAEALAIRNLFVETKTEMELKLMISGSCKAPDYLVIMVGLEYTSQVKDLEDTNTDSKSCST